jgi:hypothetical protein
VVWVRAVGRGPHSRQELLSELRAVQSGTIAASVENVLSHRPHHKFDSMFKGLRLSSSAWKFNQSHCCDVDTSSAVPVTDSIGTFIYIYATAMHARW